jgi:hypothetical protein
VPLPLGSGENLKAPLGQASGGEITSENVVLSLPAKEALEPGQATRGSFCLRHGSEICSHGYQDN